MSVVCLATKVDRDYIVRAYGAVGVAVQNLVAADGRQAEETAKKELEHRKLERATFFWAAASCIALVVCGALGLGLLQTVVEFSNRNVPGWFEALEVVVTGLAIGAGTKPLHDLIGAIQKAKEGGAAA